MVGGADYSVGDVVGAEDGGVVVGRARVVHVVVTGRRPGPEVREGNGHDGGGGGESGESKGSLGVVEATEGEETLVTDARGV